MKANHLVPKPDSRVAFHLRDFRLVPNCPGCYAITTFDEEILYIGLSVNLNARFQQHLDNPAKIGITAKGKPTWFHFMKYDEQNLEKLERTWHNQYLNEHAELPLLNVNNSPLR